MQVAGPLSRWARFKLLIKQGWHEIPEIYFVGLGFAISGSVIISGFIASPYGGYVQRYKHRYTVMRPDDERLVRYPKEFITDAHLLPPRKVEPDFNTPHPIRFSNVVFHNEKP